MDSCDLACGRYKLSFNKTLIMGILNVTPDSFSDGGMFLQTDDAILQAKKMIEYGADIIDIGGESSRPGAEPLPIEEELQRVLPVIETLAKEVKVPLSIDSYHAKVAEECLLAGASMINDISGLEDMKMMETAKKYQAPVVIMHMRGAPKNMQDQPLYKDVVKEVTSFLAERTRAAQKMGIKDIILDPGIGFGKTVEHNLQLLKAIPQIKKIGCPVLIGASRKSFIGKITGASINERLPGSIAAACIAALNGANIIRTHEIRETKQALQLIDAYAKTKQN